MMAFGNYYFKWVETWTQILLETESGWHVALKTAVKMTGTTNQRPGIT